MGRLITSIASVLAAVATASALADVIRAVGHL